MRKEIITLEETDLWRISMIDGDTDTVTISISSSPRIGQEFANEEFIGTASKHGKAIFLIDKTNSFGNLLDWQHILEVMSPHIEDKRVRAIGFCMGGFLSIVLSKYIVMDCVVAITPQYSIMDGYIDRSNFPADLYTDRVSEWKIPTLDGYFSDDTNYYVMYTQEQMDLDQIKHFPSLDNVFLIDFGTDFDHGLPGQLGDDLDILVDACFEHEPWVLYEFIENHYA
jgi:hypothetical protein